jgi:hypothetical protein
LGIFSLKKTIKKAINDRQIKILNSCILDLLKIDNFTNSKVNNYCLDSMSIEMAQNKITKSPGDLMELKIGNLSKNCNL